MNTLHFKYAVEVEKTRSITQAAENLYMAQPNLSKAIKELEASLGINIFRRTSKGVIPTEQGVEFLEYAKQVLIQISKMEKIHAPGKSQSNKLKVAAPRTGYISQAFSLFLADLEDRDEMEIYFCETNFMKIIENVRENGYDFGVLRYKTAYDKYIEDYLVDKNLSYDVLWEYEMIALMAEDHPAAKWENLTYNNLADQHTELCYADDAVPNISGVTEKLFTGIRPDIENPERVYLYDRGTALVLLHSDTNTFILDSPVSPEILKHHGLVQRKCDFPDNHYKDVLIYAADHKLAEKEIAFLNRIYEVRNDVAFMVFK